MADKCNRGTSADFSLCWRTGGEKPSTLLTKTPLFLAFTDISRQKSRNAEQKKAEQLVTLSYTLPGRPAGCPARVCRPTAAMPGAHRGLGAALHPHLSCCHLPSLRTCQPFAFQHEQQAGTLVSSCHGGSRLGRTVFL